MPPILMGRKLERQLLLFHNYEYNTTIINNYNAKC